MDIMYGTGEGEGHTPHTNPSSPRVHSTPQRRQHFLLLTPSPYIPFHSIIIMIITQRIHSSLQYI